jgi:hypothetical protein
METFYVTKVSIIKNHHLSQNGNIGLILPAPLQNPSENREITLFLAAGI